jgi:hypothetical protein
MGQKGVKRTAVAREAADAIVGILSPIGEVRSRGMFGGFGVSPWQNALLRGSTAYP